jgi:ADP-dependent phosphofructokinase/glucokinase
MRLRITDPLTRCYIITSAILFVGLGSAIAIYLTAGEAPNDPFAEFEKSKKYAYELERMGGKAALAANEFNKWFSGLWQGETLAYTVAVITIIIAAIYYFIATSLEEEARSKSRDNLPTAFKDHL